MNQLKICFFFLCLPFSLLCQIQDVPLVVDADNDWIKRTYHLFQGYTSSTRYQFKPEVELVGATEYLRLQSSLEETGQNWNDLDLYRQDGKKVYLLEGDQEYLILDFSLSIQDTFISDRPNFINDTLIVTEVDSIVLLDGSKRKRLTLTCHDEIDVGPLYGPNVWVEGIGSLAGGVNFEASCFFDRESMLACYSRAEEHLFERSEDEDCWFVEYNTCNYLQGDAEWFFSPWIMNCNEPYLHKIEVIGDSIVDYRLCSVVAIIENGNMVAGSELVLHYGLTRVDFYEDGVFRNLYNFDPGLQVGDILTYSLPKNFHHYNIYAIDYMPNDMFFENRITEINMIDNGSGDLVREFITEPIFENDVEEECHWMRRIIEGAGATSGLLGQGCILIADGCFDGMTCHFSGDFSYTISSGQCVPSSVIELPESELSIYPNPFTEEFSFKTDLEFEFVELYSFDGRMLLKEKYSQSIKLNDIQTGMYLILLKDKRGDTVVRKIVKE